MHEKVRLKVLVACEESQALATRFRALGHQAWSCDIEPCSGGHPEFHLQQDVRPLLAEPWDLIVAFPPCTYLAGSGARWFNIERYGEKAWERHRRRDQAVAFVMAIAGANSKHIAIENPVGFLSSWWRKPDQIIQPYFFGDPYEKTTCLWLKNLPPLARTNPVRPEPRAKYSGGTSMPPWISNANPKDRARLRSKTFPGVADAMVQQWSAHIANLSMHEKVSP